VILTSWQNLTSWQIFTSWQNLTSWHVIAAMAIVTILIRLSGFFIMKHVPLTPFVKAMLEALPGSILAATVVPLVVKTGGEAYAGLAVALVVAYFTRRDFIALVLGLLTVSLMRAYR
jgi:uncharacterized membrane protein